MANNKNRKITIINWLAKGFILEFENIWKKVDENKIKVKLEEQFELNKTIQIDGSITCSYYINPKEVESIIR